MNTTAQAQAEAQGQGQASSQDTITTQRTARRADAGTVRLSQRDIDGLML